jgi:hypothetical protein
MIIAWMFRMTGGFLYYFSPEDLCVAILFILILPLLFVASYIPWLGSVVAIFILYRHLTLSERPLPCADYGSHEKNNTVKLGTHGCLSRDDIVCNKGKWFEDKAGRKLIMRGINVSGSSKFPLNCPSHSVEHFFDTENVSFVGRPFPLQDAHEHFYRIRACGLTFIRLLVPWEAIEHAGPGIYDEEYLAYLLQIVRIAQEYNLSCMIDPHQDVWSRWTGGDGAPSWTLEIAGFDITTLHKSGAAFTQQGHILQHGVDAPLPCMHWPSNHHRLATATMFTLFFGGNDFCPGFMVDGMNIQDYFQTHYFAAYRRVAILLAAESNVIGFDSMNEPNLGMIGWNDLSKESVFLRQGPSPTFFESFQLGDGETIHVKNYVPSLVYAGQVALNVAKVRAWKHTCIWEDNNVWGRDINGHPVLHQPEYFKYRIVDGHPHAINLQEDYFMPFIDKFRAAINCQEHTSGAYMIFVDRVTNFETASISEPMPSSISLENLAWAPHWYDLVPLVTKSFRTWVGIVRDFSWSLPLVFGRDNVIKEYTRQLKLIASCVENINDGKGIPTIVGEIGIPFDIDKGLCYVTGDYSRQTSSMNITISALEKSMLSGILWNYTPDHTPQYGDGWNGEDLSIFSPDPLDKSLHADLFSGGRALPAIVRPYVMRCAGTPLLMTFDIVSREFYFEFTHSETKLITAATVVFVPFFQYPLIPNIIVTGATYDFDHPNQTLLLFHDETYFGKHTIRIFPTSVD